MSEDLVSIIVPVYNSQKCIERCIFSIVEQSYNNIEIIIIDDGSTDKTAKMCDQFASHDNRIIVKHISNAGVSNARNEGIKIAKGKYIQFVDSDDVVEKDMTKLLVNKIQCDNSDVVICGYNQYIGNRLLKIGVVDGTYSYKDFLTEMMRWMTEPIIGAPWNKLYKRDIIVDNSLLFDTTTNYAEDYLFNINYFGFVKSISVIKRTLYSYYIANNNSLHNINTSDIEHVWKVNKAILDLNENTMKMQNVENLNYMCSLYNFLLCTSIISRVRTNNKDEVINWIRQNYNPMYGKYKPYLNFSHFPKISLISLLIKNIAKNRFKNSSYRLIDIICGNKR